MKTRNQLIKDNLGGLDALPKITGNGDNLPNFKESMKKQIVDFSKTKEQSK